MRFSILFLIVSVAAPLGCGGQGGAQPSVEESIAKAVQLESKDQKAREQIEASHRAAKDEARKSEEATVAARNAEIDAAATLPSPMPADVATACDAVVAAYDDFMKRGPERDALEWFEGRRKKMGERRATCMSQGNLSVAACQGRALMAPLPSLAELPRLEAAAMVTTRCADKFGANGGKPAAGL